MKIRSKRPILRSHRLVVLLVGGATVIAAGLIPLVAGHPQRPAARPVTPTPLAVEPFDSPILGGDLAERLAVAAGRDLSADRVGPASSEHLHIVSWHLHSQVDGGTTTSALAETEYEAWRAANDSGRIVQRSRQPSFASERDRRTWQQDNPASADLTPQVDTFQAGQFPALWLDRPPVDDRLSRWLQRHRRSADWPAAAPDAIVDLLRERVLKADERAALIRFIAFLPGVEVTGTATDRVGRRGYAVSVTSDYSGLPSRRTFLIDPGTGRFLAFEELLTSTPGRLNVAVPAVIGYYTFLAAEHVAGSKT